MANFKKRYPGGLASDAGRAAGQVMPEWATMSEPEVSWGLTPGEKVVEDPLSEDLALARKQMGLRELRDATNGGTELLTSLSDLSDTAAGMVTTMAGGRRPVPEGDLDRVKLEMEMRQGDHNPPGYAGAFRRQQYIDPPQRPEIHAPVQRPELAEETLDDKGYDYVPVGGTKKNPKMAYKPSPGRRATVASEPKEKQVTTAVVGDPELDKRVSPKGREEAFDAVVQNARGRANMRRLRMNGEQNYILGGGGPASESAKDMVMFGPRHAANLAENRLKVDAATRMGDKRIDADKEMNRLDNETRTTIASNKSAQDAPSTIIAAKKQINDMTPEGRLENSRSRALEAIRNGQDISTVEADITPILTDAWNEKPDETGGDQTWSNSHFSQVAANGTGLPGVPYNNIDDFADMVSNRRGIPREQVIAWLLRHPEVYRKNWLPALPRH